jgi:hypothetical protein
VRHKQSPSGQLCLEVSDPRALRWNSRNLVGRWYDRDDRAVEQCLGDVVSALEGAAAAVALVRAETKARAEALAEQAAQQAQDDARLERKERRREFMAAKAREYAVFVELQAFAKFMAAQAKRGEPVDRIVKELQARVDELARKFDREALNAEIARLGLFSGDDTD